jgi:5-methylcytosine-specific restriction endonuclease McrA
MARLSRRVTGRTSAFRQSTVVYSENGLWPWGAHLFAMTASILDKPVVLALNSAWQPIGHRTVRQALVALTGGDRGNPPAVGLDIAYRQNADGSWNFDEPLSMIPLKWDDWFKLPVREFDLSISTARQQVRVPTVIIASNFSKMPMTQPRLSRDAIFERDGGVCQYTGEYVGRDGGNLDHVIARSAGGRNSFENLVWAKREINSRKADKLPHQVGLRLIRPPKAPKKIPVSATFREARHPDWAHFLS